MRAAGVVTSVLAVVAVVAVVALALVVGGLGGRDDGRGDRLSPAGVDRGTPVTRSVPLASDLDVEPWAARTAERIAVPERALQAHAAAEIAQRAALPACGLSWTTLAAIGRVESDHGRIGPARLDDDGVARPPIIGIPLDGTRGTREIRDTDGGRLDGDTVYDRAVGPMQFLPTTWARYGADGDGDGVANPHDLDDAALAAARYLCADGRDTASGEGWWDGVLAYNRSVEYARLVWAAADGYATSSTAP
ncbi:MAG TPA: lytic murein transglycosylase [Pseudonocardia sp.]|jgi:membrane-bound lytic murein transglycosylase B|nr:lytic murein transglycosylase [Pseudonocardia sp.]